MTGYRHRRDGQSLGNGCAVEVHVRQGMRYSFVVAAVLLFCAGAVAIFYFDTFWGVLIPVTLVFFQRAGWRILYQTPLAPHRDPLHAGEVASRLL